MAIITPTCWILFHSDKVFENEYTLRDWLIGGLKKDNGGCYFLTKRFSIKPGSVLLFERNGFIVGSAIAKETVRKPTQDENTLAGTYKLVLRIIPDSIWVWKEPFVSLQDLKIEGIKIPLGIPAQRISIFDILKIFSIVCKTNVG